MVRVELFARLQIQICGKYVRGTSLRRFDGVLSFVAWQCSEQLLYGNYREVTQAFI